MPGIGFSLGIGSRGAGGSDFPSSLPLTGWVRCPFAGSPWVGTVSTGTSGANNAAEASSAPDVGAPLAGFNTADFELANLDRITFDGPLGPCNVMFSGSGGAAWALIKTESVRADQANAYDESAIIMDATLFVALVVASSGVRAAVYDGAWKFSPYQALSVGEWGLAQMRWNGTTLQSRVNGGAWQSVACGTATLSVSGVQLGRNANTTLGYFDGLIAEAGMINAHLTDAQFDNIKAYVNSRYALNL